MFDFSVFGRIISVYSLFLGLTSFVGILLFLVFGFGLFNISKKLKINNPWLAFIPVVSDFMLGRVGDFYVKNDGRRAKPLKIWFLILSALNWLLFVTFGLVFAIFISKFYFGVSDILKANEELTLEIFKILIPIVVFYLVLAVITITYKVIYYICLWRVFNIFDNKNAIIYLVLSVFFGFLPPIFIFVVSNKQPKFTFEERMGISDNG